MCVQCSVSSTTVAVGQLPESARQRAVTEPVAFVDLMDGLHDDSAGIQRYALEHLLFPDVFTPVVGRGHRQQILRTWPALADLDTEPSSFRRAAVANQLTPFGDLGGCVALIGPGENLALAGRQRVEQAQDVIALLDSADLVSGEQPR